MEKETLLTVPATVSDKLAIHMGHHLASGTMVLDEKEVKIEVTGGGFSLFFSVRVGDEYANVSIPMETLMVEVVQAAQRLKVPA